MGGHIYQVKEKKEIKSIPKKKRLEYAGKTKEKMKEM